MSHLHRILLSIAVYVVAGGSISFSQQTSSLSQQPQTDLESTANETQDLTSPRSKGNSVIRIWHDAAPEFGHLGGHPQRWVNILGDVNSAGLRSLEFRLDDGPWRQLSWREDRKRLARDGDFNVELDRDELHVGKNQLVVRATFAGNRIEEKRVTFEYKNPSGKWPLPYRVDWQKVSKITDAVQVVDGQWQLTEEGVRTSNRYYDRVLAFGDDSWRDYEVTTRMKVHALTGPREGANQTGVTHAAIAVRWPGHDQDGKQPSVKWHPLGATAEFRLGKSLQQCRWRIFDGQREYYAESKRRRKLQFESWYSMKHRVTTRADGSSLFQVKLWSSDGTEPAEWDFHRVEPKDDVPTGSALLLAHHSDVTFGNITVIPIGEAKSLDQTNGQR